MNGTFFERIAALAAEAFIQTVPPGLMAAFAANELSKAAHVTFAQSAGIVTAGLLVCIMFSTVRD